MNMRRWAWSGFVLMGLGIGVAGFGSSCQKSNPVDVKTAASLPAAGLTGTFRVELLDGTLEMKAPGGSWRHLAEGEVTTDVRELRALGAGAELRWFNEGSEQLRLWLKGGTVARLGQSPDGSVALELAEGQARVRRFGTKQLHWIVAGESLVIQDSDVLLSVTDKAHHMVQSALSPERLSWSVELGASREASGLGTLKRVGAGGDVWIRLDSVDVNVAQQGHQALIEVEHRFQAEPGERPIEGVFRFPLPHAAALVGLAMDIDGKLMEGELVERTKAQQVYEQIVDSMRDPALLEWEPGNVFKLRVFPIQPGETKRVVVRYLTPLERDENGHGTLRLDVGAPPLQGEAPKVGVRLDGARVHEKADAFPEQGYLKLVGKPLLGTYLSKAEDGTYLSTSVVLPAPSADAPSGPRVAKPRDVLVVVDTSRSALEARELQLQVVEAVLTAAGPEDRVKLATSDLQVTELTADWLEPEAAREVLGKLSKVELDGASDLEGALSYAAAQRAQRAAEDRSFEVLFVGDTTPTWGETSSAPLGELAAAIGAPLNVLVLGASADVELARHLSAMSGGLMAHPRTRTEVRSWLSMVSAVAGVERYSRVRIEGAEAYPKAPRTLLPGERLSVVVRVPTGEPLPEKVYVVAERHGQSQRLPVSLAGAKPAPWIRQRFGKALLNDLEQSGAEKPAIVEASLKHQVMSRHTAFLVLESEEAYKRFNIERTRSAENVAPQVTGGDLESVGPRSPSLSPDRLQPGDPEVLVPAPADARSVRVIFPFGETKEAEYEPELRAWSVRFLVDAATPDGVYPVTVRIEHSDARVELLELSYVVDTAAPEMAFELVKQGRRWVLEARQTKDQLERLLVGVSSRRKADILTRRFGQDAGRAEVQLASGEVLPMTAILFAHFQLQLPLGWEPGALDAPVPLSVWVWDKAGNLRKLELEVRNGGVIVERSNEAVLAEGNL